MSSCSAASRREAPPSTCAITSMRMSAEYAFGIVRPQTNQCRQTRPFTGPWESCDSIRPEHALGPIRANKRHRPQPISCDHLVGEDVELRDREPECVGGLLASLRRLTVGTTAVKLDILKL